MKQYIKFISKTGNSVSFIFLFVFFILDLPAQSGPNASLNIQKDEILDIQFEDNFVNEYANKRTIELLAPPPSCKGAVTSDTKTANWQWRAKGKAKKNWKDKVKNQYGKSWKKWGKARNKNWNCYGPSGSAACYVTAEPCK